MFTIHLSLFLFVSGVAEHLDTYGEEMLAVYALPKHKCKQMRSTNMLGRFNQVIKQRTMVIRIFPNEASCIRLVSALAMEENEKWMGRKYLNMDAENESHHCSQTGRKLISTGVPINDTVLSP